MRLLWFRVEFVRVLKYRQHCQRAGYAYALVLFVPAGVRVGVLLPQALR